MNAHDIAKGWSAWARLKGRLKLAIGRRLWRYDVGPGTSVHPTALLDRTWPSGLHIGRDCVIGAEAAILSHDFTRGLLLDTRLGDRCAVGQRAIVMPGLTIGEGSVIMPGAIVTKDVPPGSIVFGNPATIEPRPAEPVG